MPRILVTEAEKAELLKQREVRALQALAWNEALAEACVVIRSMAGGHETLHGTVEEAERHILSKQRPTNGLA